MTVFNGASATPEIQESGPGWISSERLRAALAEHSIAIDRELGHGGMSAEITDVSHGTVLNAVGPITAPVDRPGDAIDSLGLGIEAGLRRQLHSEAASHS